MGLDMFLYEKKYISRHEFLAEKSPEYASELEVANQILDLAGLKTEEDGGITVSATVMYWRKANAIHQWFVNNVVPEGLDDNSQDWYVDRSQLIELRDLAQEVLGRVETEHREKVPTGGYTIGPEGRTDHHEPGRVILNPEVAEELLPTTGGFFFGSTNYNEWYLQDLERTVEGLNRVLDNQAMRVIDGKEYPVTDFVYHPSW